MVGTLAATKSRPTPLHEGFITLIDRERQLAADEREKELRENFLRLHPTDSCYGVYAKTDYGPRLIWAFDRYANLIRFFREVVGVHWVCEDCQAGFTAAVDELSHVQPRPERPVKLRYENGFRHPEMQEYSIELISGEAVLAQVNADLADRKHRREVAERCSGDNYDNL